ncbi:hypothetical protein TNCT_688671 [Trichonephila clavata]|uniref:Uncharacterized protein n=1 Tax=Trichonephila clavata TaxID=2740835 RepID=A0A8X6M5V0_TRICU|nr:hypothetical protein TNCT_688671 [Trichonephila clavata]
MRLTLFAQTITPRFNQHEDEIKQPPQCFRSLNHDTIQSLGSHHERKLKARFLTFSSFVEMEKTLQEEHHYFIQHRIIYVFILSEPPATNNSYDEAIFYSCSYVC